MDGRPLPLREEVAPQGQRRRGREAVCRRARQFLQLPVERDRLGAHGGEQRGPARVAILQEQRVVVAVGRIADRHVEPLADRVAQPARVGDRLGGLAHQRDFWIAVGELEQQAVVVQPDVERERRVVAKRGLSAAEQRVDHLPRPPEEEQEAGLRHKRLPDIEKQRRSRLLPAPCPATSGPRGDQIGRLS